MSVLATGRAVLCVCVSPKISFAGGVDENMCVLFLTLFSATNNKS